jgi:hypothetical protein
MKGSRIDTDTPEGQELLLSMTLAYLAGHTDEPAKELRRKLDGLSDEERRALIAYLSTPTHTAPGGNQ